MLVVNLFAGPGAGKSTMAASVFADLKRRGVCAELVTEFAKDLTWEGNQRALECQPYVFGQQLWRMQRLRDRGVEVIVTDSPLLLSTVYMPDDWDYPRRHHWAEFVIAESNTWREANFVVTRKRTFDARGRNQTEAEARMLDEIIVRTLELAGVDYGTVDGTPEGARVVVENVVHLL
jgi:hypothetical protein